MSRSRTKEFLKGTVSTVLLQLIITLSGFIIPRVMLTVYGSEVNGIVTSLTQFINYFTLIEAGLGGAAIYALYQPLADRDHKRINAIAAAAKNLYLRSGWIFVGLIFLLAFAFPWFADIASLRSWEIFALTFIIGMTGVLDFFTLSKYRVLLTADQRVYVISLASAAYYIVYTAIIAFASFLDASVVVIRALALSAIVIRSVILVVYCKKKYRWLDLKQKPDYTAIKSKNDVLYQQICGMVQTGMPVILATFLIGDFKAVSVFTVYNMVLTGINGVLGVFSTSLASGFGNVIVSGDKPLLRKTYGEFESAYHILITVVYATTMVLLLPFVRLYTADVHDVNYILPTFAGLMVWNGLLYNIKTPPSMLVVSAGMYRQTRLQNTVTALIIVVLGVPFTLLWGLNGIMVASILSNIYRTVDFVFFVHKHITEDKPRESIFRMARVLFFMAAATVVTWQVQLTADTVLSWIGWGVGVLVIATAVIGGAMGFADRAHLGNLLFRLRSLFGKEPQPAPVPNLCTGCGLCAAACPTGAITMQPDAMGFLYPVIDQAKCVSCGKCQALCPMGKELSGNQTQGFLLAQALEQSILSTATSGGVATALSKAFIAEKAGTVYGAAFDDQMKLRHIRCANLDDCEKIKGSKYVQSDLTGIYDAVTQDLKNGTPVLFIGTPCQCAAMAIRFGEDPGFYACDLICNGVGSPAVFARHLKQLEKIYKTTAAGYCFRPKTGSYLEPYEVLKAGDGKDIRLISPWEKWGSLYYNGLVMRQSCYSCSYTTETRAADLTFCDIPHSAMDTDKLTDVRRWGATCVSVNTAKGEALSALLETCCRCTGTQPIDKERMHKPIACPPAAGTFRQSFAAGSLETAKRKTLGLKLKVKSQLIKKLRK